MSANQKTTKAKKVKQKEYQNVYEQTLVNIMFTSNTLEQNLKEVFKSFGITSPQYNILRILKGSHPKPLSPGEIKKVMITTGSDVTRIIDRLLSKQLVTRIVCSSNRRKMEISISKEGINLLKVIYPKLQLIFNKIGSGLTQKEAEHVNKALDKIRGKI